MDRFGVFVDAGYLHAGAGELCFGVIQRHRLGLDATSFCEALAERGRVHCGFQHLRSYWYDGARGAQPTAEHIQIANLPGVKLRLGRLTQDGQKGVDSRIVRDLIVLSQERAIATAYLLGGDEDLREGVAEAQERGVRVVLVAIEASGVAATLRMEADDLVTLDKAFLVPHLTLLEQRGADPVVAQVPRPAGSEEPNPRGVGVEFGTAWWNAAASELRNEVRRGQPRIPSDLDSSLLQTAAKVIGGGELSIEWRYELRAGFWEAVDTLTALATDTATPE